MMWDPILRRSEAHDFAGFETDGDLPGLVAVALGLEACCTGLVKRFVARRPREHAQAFRSAVGILHPLTDEPHDSVPPRLAAAKP